FTWALSLSLATTSGSVAGRGGALAGSRRCGRASRRFVLAAFRSGLRALPFRGWLAGAQSSLEFGDAADQITK
ncbi:MAG TPA: hypothetical protein VF397_14050, partial [Pyrinomonadaceae bacterium]